MTSWLCNSDNLVGQLLGAVSHSQNSSRHIWLSDWHHYHTEKASAITFQNHLEESCRDFCLIASVEIMATKHNEYVLVEHKMRHDVFMRGPRFILLRQELAALRKKVRTATLRAVGMPEGYLVCIECEELMFEVVCVDNVGVEDGFDQGIEYLAEKHDDVEMTWVYDKFGVKREMLVDRFTVAKEEIEA